MKVVRKIASGLYALSALGVIADVAMTVIGGYPSSDAGGAAIGIIGGADGPTAMFLVEALFGLGGKRFLFFSVLAIGCSILNLLAAFSQKRISNIVMLLWVVANAALCLLIPASGVLGAGYTPAAEAVLFFVCGFIPTPKNLFLVVSVGLFVLYTLRLKQHIQAKKQGALR